MNFLGIMTKVRRGYRPQINDDEGEFFDYVDFIDHCWKKFDADNRLLRFEDFIMNHGRNKEIKRVSINKEEEEKK